MLGERIRQLRNAHNISQVQLADKLGVSKQSVSNWENGNIMPSIEMLVKISKLFGVSTDYLLGLDDKVTLDIDGLSTEKLAFLQNMIKYLH